MTWIHQRKTFEIGNFVSLTPAIKVLSQRLGVRIPTYFDTPVVKELYLNCPYMELMDSIPKGWGKPKLSTRKTSKQSANNDYSLFLLEIGYSYHVDPYVDTCGEEDEYVQTLLPERPVALIHGCLGEHWLKAKDLGSAFRQDWIDAAHASGLSPVIIGSKKDREQFWQHTTGCVNLAGELTIRQSVSALRQCGYFLSNDTGLMHVAAALRIPGIVYWKDTPFMKNVPPFMGIRHIDYHTGIDKIICKS